MGRTQTVTLTKKAARASKTASRGASKTVSRNARSTSKRVKVTKKTRELSGSRLKPTGSSRQISTSKKVDKHRSQSYANRSRKLKRALVESSRSMSPRRGKIERKLAAVVGTKLGRPSTKSVKGRKPRSRSRDQRKNSDGPTKGSLIVAEDDDGQNFRLIARSPTHSHKRKGDSSRSNSRLKTSSKVKITRRKAVVSRTANKNSRHPSKTSAVRKERVSSSREKKKNPVGRPRSVVSQAAKSPGISKSRSRVTKTRKDTVSSSARRKSTSKAPKPAPAASRSGTSAPRGRGRPRNTSQLAKRAPATSEADPIEISCSPPPIAFRTSPKVPTRQSPGARPDKHIKTPTKPMKSDRAGSTGRQLRAPASDKQNFRVVCAPGSCYGHD